MLGELTRREEQVILFIRQLGWGEVKIRVENGQPVLIYEAIRTVRLEEDTRAEKPPKAARPRIKP